MNTELLFKNLFARALREWPQSLDLELETQMFEGIVPTNEEYDLVRYKNLPWDKSFEHYIVKGLYDLCESAANKCVGQAEWILMCNLHDVIYSNVRNISKYFSHIEFKNLRPEIIQAEFEDGIKKGLKDGLDWNEKSIKLIKKYFEVNYPYKKNPWT